MIKAFQELRLSSADMQRSDQGGWHSLDNLHQSPETNIQWLTQEVLRIGTQSIRHIEDQDFKGKIGLAGL